MFVRMRWFTLGIVVSLTVTAYVAGRLRRARERLTARNVSRELARVGAATLEAAAARLEPQHQHR
jgi:hypothetical protein